ncbi:hypothetical protein, partial [Methylobacterium sp. J-070]|uniref:hypothetical protein n=1 Tax=Methylobacterium sp. J-070 TaxID=2836650 RepID=UPI001FB9A8E9
ADKTDRKGDYFAPGMVRTTSRRPMSYGGRQGTMIRVVGRKGAIVDAFLPADASTVTELTALGHR